MNEDRVWVNISNEAFLAMAKVCRQLGSPAGPIVYDDIITMDPEAPMQLIPMKQSDYNILIDIAIALHKTIDQVILDHVEAAGRMIQENPAMFAPSSSKTI